MKVITLTFAYDINKLFEIGRFWAKDVYIDKEFIFEYSAASYATFLDKNPELKLHLYTDDIMLIKEKLSKYNVNLDNIIYYDYSEKINSYKGKLKYSFDILHDFIIEAKSDEEYTIKIDCDLTFYDKIPTINNKGKDVLVWKYERMLFEGDPRMGEIKSSVLSVGDVNYKIFNVGLLGFPPNFKTNELDEIYRKMADVDILDVSDLNIKSWHCAEQTAKNWLFHKYNYNVIETYNIVNHHFSIKKNCIDEAKYLLKQ
jgi:hypothetical protein